MLNLSPLSMTGEKIFGTFRISWIADNYMPSLANFYFNYHCGHLYHSANY